MRTKGSPQWCEAVRRLAVGWVCEGYDVAEVAGFVGVHVCSVHRWLAEYRKGGDAALAAVPHPGAAPKLSPRQAQRVLSWVRERSPQDFGFLTGHWTARRVAAVIEQRLGVHFNPRYLNDWLTRHGISPQIPQRIPRERDDVAIDRWLSHTWPAIKRGQSPRARPSSSPMKRAY